MVVDVVEKQKGELQIGGGYKKGGEQKGEKVEEEIKERKLIGRGKYIRIREGEGKEDMRN